MGGLYEGPRYPDEGVTVQAFQDPVGRSRGGWSWPSVELRSNSKSTPGRGIGLHFTYN